MIKDEIIKQFNIPGELIDVNQITAGKIHKTYVAKYSENGEETKYLIQQVNNYVFENPYDVMNNIETITSYLEKELEKSGDQAHKTLKVIKTVDNKNMVVCKNKNGEEEFYRAYNFIDNAICYDYSEEPEVARIVGKAFGNFQKLLNNYPIEALSETIKNFHNTKNRFMDFEQDLKADCADRVRFVGEEIKFIIDRKEFCNIIIQKLENKEIPYRVTHNDTKLNNVMINKQTGDFLAVVDLDTVMPGSGLYDYGDGARSVASNIYKNEIDLNKICLRNDLFESYTDGYFSEVAPYMNEDEVRLMGASIKLMSLELGIRYLGDYINGDKYFKGNYEKHNLDRARKQLKLVEDIENKMDYINSYIWESYKKYNK